MFDQGPTPLIEAPELHPENPERIRNIRSALKHGPIAPQLEWHAGRHATPAELELVHDPAYIRSVQAACAAGPGLITQSTPVVPASWGAALASAGTALAATEAVLAGESPLAYALVRPPGHHAQPAQADGYCLFSNAALCAQLARTARARARRRRRLGRAPRQRHPGLLLGPRRRRHDLAAHATTARGGRTIPRPARPDELGGGRRTWAAT